MKEHVEPLLKADFRLFETYQSRLAVLPYAVACAAVGDDRVLDSQLEAVAGAAAAVLHGRFDATWTAVVDAATAGLVDDPIAFLAWFGPWLCWLSQRYRCHCHGGRLQASRSVTISATGPGPREERGASSSSSGFPRWTSAKLSGARPEASTNDRTSEIGSRYEKVLRQRLSFR